MCGECEQPSTWGGQRTTVGLVLSFHLTVGSGGRKLNFQVFMANTLTGGAALETHSTQFSILSWWEKGNGCVPVTSMKWRDSSTTEIPFDL